MIESAASPAQEAPAGPPRLDPTAPPVPARFAGLEAWLTAFREDLRERLDGAENCLPLLADRVERLALAAEEAELPGLQDSALFLCQHLLDLSARDSPGLAPAERALLREWPERVEDYLRSAGESAEALVEYLCRPAWPQPVKAADAAVLRELFGRAEDNAAAPADGADADVDADLLDMLGEEIQRLRRRLAGDRGEPVDALQLSRQIERFGNAAQTAGLSGLSGCAAFVVENLQRAPAAALACVASWLDGTAAYLRAPERPAAESLLATLRGAEWPVPWPAAQGTAMLAALQRVKRREAAADAPPAADGTDTDASLTVADDITPELLDGLLEELPQQTARLSAAVQAGCRGGGRAAIDEAQRVAHTIKGAALTVGVKGLANLTHRLEDVLLYLRDRALQPGGELQGALLQACDCLEEMGEALLGMGEPPAEASQVLERLGSWADRLRRDGPAAGAAHGAPANVDGAPGEAEGAAAERAAGAPPLRVPAGAIDELLRGVGETLILGSQLQERVGRAADLQRQLAARTEYLREVVDELDQAIGRQRLAGEAPASDQVLDVLELERFNELHTIGHRLVEAAADSQEMSKGIAGQLRELEELLVGQQRLNRETQYIGMQSRMLPLKTIVPRLQRVVRQTGRATGKAVRLEITGEQTPLDSDVLNALIEPLTHMLRNAVDHGIEPGELRRRLGKDAEGRIALDCGRDGNQILIRCADDGAGLDLERIRDRAVAHGLLEDDGEYTDAQLADLVFVAGLSTRAETSQISGRGVGLDIVSAALGRINGAIRVETRAGRGCTFELRVPISLISVQVLLAVMRGRQVALATHGIEQILHPDSSDADGGGAAESFVYEGERRPLCRLEDLLGLEPDRRSAARETRPILLVRDGDALRAVSVEQVRKSLEVVVKGLGRYLPRVTGALGATILGDGAIAPVLDPAELLRHGRAGAVSAAPPPPAHTAVQALPTALIVDDSVSARRTLAQALMDMGVRVRTAKDGLEAIAFIEQQVPDLLLADLEMPRMNGLELAAHLRSSRATAGLPIIMITSRSTGKHRRLAEAAGVDVYLTKPYTDDALFDHVSELLAAGRGGAAAR